MNVPSFDFMGRRKIAAMLSVALVLASIVLLGVRGLNLGLDFTGGSLVEVGFQQPVDPEAVRRQLEATGFENGLVQHFGTDVDLLIRMPSRSGANQSTLGDRMLEAIQATYPAAKMRQSNYVGPVVGEELTESAGLALLAALGVVMLYILFRFTKQFSVGAVVALAHDVIIVFGIFSLAQWTFDLPVVAALLAVIGY